MHIIIAILAVIALTLIGGPVVGGLALIGALCFLIPGFGVFLGGAILLIALLVFFGINSIFLLTGIFVAIVLVSILMNDLKVKMKEREKEQGILDRKLVEGTDIYEDKNGQRWKKVAGIYKPID